MPAALLGFSDACAPMSCCSYLPACCSAISWACSWPEPSGGSRDCRAPQLLHDAAVGGRLPHRHRQGQRRRRRHHGHPYQYAGEPNAAATALDGYPLAKAGKAEKALKVALYASVAGDILATAVLIAVAEPLARLACAVGPVELTALTFLALTFIAALSGRSLARGLIAAFFGILVAMIGTDAETASPRLTFGFIELADGVPIMAVTVGMLALTEMLIQGEEYLTQPRDTPLEPPTVTSADRQLTLAEIKSISPTTLISSGVGIVAGIIPGLGPTVASFLAYALAKRWAKPHERFGEGEIKGVAAAETADNAVVPASLIPLFALGLPGSVSAAIIIAAFTVHGVTPGPRMFEEHGRLMYGIYGAMIVPACSCWWLAASGSRCSPSSPAFLPLSSFPA